MKLNVSPITLTPNHEHIVLLGVVINKEPPGCKINVEGVIRFF